MTRTFKKKKFYILFFILLFILSFGYFYNSSKNKSTHAEVEGLKTQSLPILSETDLKKYNGDDPSMPIYLAYDGLVYDISKGREFYKPGGSYHDLAGKDSTPELKIFGGDIIKRKYPVIARLRK